MSGGHWGYENEALNRQAEFVSAQLNLNAELSKVLDLGLSCDACIDCAKIKCGYALTELYDIFYSDKYFKAECVEKIIMNVENVKCHKCSLHSNKITDVNPKTLFEANVVMRLQSLEIQNNEILRILSSISEKLDSK